MKLAGPLTARWTKKCAWERGADLPGAIPQRDNETRLVARRPRIVGVVGVGVCIVIIVLRRWTHRLRGRGPVGRGLTDDGPGCRATGRRTRRRRLPGRW